ncbi:hypothetical protein LINPERHAP2_LOCUS3614 [Linum perenne]
MHATKLVIGKKVSKLSPQSSLHKARLILIYPLFIIMRIEIVILLSWYLIL